MTNICVGGVPLCSVQLGFELNSEKSVTYSWWKCPGKERWRMATGWGKTTPGSTLGRDRLSTRTTRTLATTAVTWTPMGIMQVTEFDIYSFKQIPPTIWAFQKVEVSVGGRLASGVTGFLLLFPYSSEPQRHVHPDQRGSAEPQAQPERLEDPRGWHDHAFPGEVLQGVCSGGCRSLSRQLDCEKQRAARQHSGLRVERLLLRGQQRQAHPERRRCSQKHRRQLGGEAFPGWAGGAPAAVLQPTSAGAVLQQLQRINGDQQWQKNKR